MALKPSSFYYTVKELDVISVEDLRISAVTLSRTGNNERKKGKVEYDLPIDIVALWKDNRIGSLEGQLNRLSDHASPSRTRPEARIITGVRDQ